LAVASCCLSLSLSLFATTRGALLLQFTRWTVSRRRKLPPLELDKQASRIQTDSNKDKLKDRPVNVNTIDAEHLQACALEGLASWCWPQITCIVWRVELKASRSFVVQRVSYQQDRAWRAKALPHGSAGWSTAGTHDSRVAVKQNVQLGHKAVFLRGLAAWLVPLLKGGRNRAPRAITHMARTLSLPT